jgi:class 3 adenylate cyclase
MPACAACRTENPAEAKFCLECGAPLAEAQPREERKLVTVLFADVTGSTALGERLDAEGLKEVMRAYFDAVRAEIEAEGGTVEKFIGDAVMAAFGVPAAHEDDAARALRAALRLRRRLVGVNAELRATHGVEIEVRVGVNTGEVLAVTAPRPGEAMATGDAVNVAARLEQSAKPGQVLVSERTVRASRGFRFRDLGPVEVRGKGAPVSVYELLGQVEADSPFGSAAPLVGRERELSLLQAVYASAVSEARPHLVTLYGEPGVGKSRFVAEFLTWAERTEPSAAIVRGRCLSYGSGVAFWPLAEILKSRAGVLDTDSAADAVDRIHGAVRDLLETSAVAEPMRAAAALAFTIGLDDPSFRFTELEPSQVQAETHAAWRAFFTGLARKTPVAVLVEDIHWADPALLDLLEHVAQRAQGPVVLLCTARPELTERRPSWGGGRRGVTGVALEPLGAEEAERLVGYLVDVDALPVTLRAEILARAEGNPFFLEEIVRRLFDEGALVRSNGGWRATDAAAGLTVPDTVQAILAARIDLLPPEPKRILQAGAVVGRVFWPGAVAALLGIEPAAVEAGVAVLEDRELVRERVSSTLAGQRELVFKHVLTRDVAYETLPRRERADAHARLTAWIESTFADRLDEHAELLAHHSREAYLAGRDATLRQKAFDYLLGAAGAARSKFVPEQAGRLADEARAIASTPSERVAALELMADAFRQQYLGDESWRCLTEAVEVLLDQEPLDRARIAKLCADAAEFRMRGPGIFVAPPPIEAARELLQLGLANVGEADSPALSRLLAAEAFGLFSTPERVPSEDELVEARAAAERARSVGERLGRADLVLAALDALACTYVVLGHYGPVQAIDLSRIPLLEGVEDAYEVSDTYFTATRTLTEIGRYRDALAVVHEGVPRIEALGGPFVSVLSWSAFARCVCGDWDGAVDAAERTIEWLGDRAADPPAASSVAYGVAAFIGAARGDDERAEDYLRGIRRAGARDPRFPGTAWAALALARLGRLGEARAELDLLEQYRINWGYWLAARCELAAEQEAWEEATELVARARAHAEAAGLLSLPAYADRLEGRAALSRGELADAAAALRRSAATFDELGAGWERACSQLDLAAATSSEATLAEARATFEAVGARRELDRAAALSASERASRSRA